MQNLSDARTFGKLLQTKQCNCATHYGYRAHNVRRCAPECAVRWHCEPNATALGEHNKMEVRGALVPADAGQVMG